MIEFSAVSNRVSEQLCRTSDAARFQSVARSFKDLSLGEIQPELSMHRGRLDVLSGAQSSFYKVRRRDGIFFRSRKLPGEPNEGSFVGFPIIQWSSKRALLRLTTGARQLQERNRNGLESQPTAFLLFLPPPVYKKTPPKLAHQTHGTRSTR